MSEPAPSRTAQLAAAARAGHLFEHGSRALLTDWLAWPLLGAGADGILAAARAMVGDLGVPVAAWFAARTRVCEDWLAASGAEQHVILGAGLESFAWRQGGDVRVFEVDHPATQAWKRQRVVALGLPASSSPEWVAIDFERARLSETLAAAGLDAARPVFVSWVGVVPYLTRDAISATLGGLPSCSLAVSYVPPADSWEGEARVVGTALQARVADMGEPWLSMLASEEVAELLAQSGFTVLEDIGSGDIESRYGLPAINHERIALARSDRRP